MSAPERAQLHRVVLDLEGAGVTAALGGSGLLIGLGLASHARDWDLTTDAPFDRVVGALGSRPMERMGPSGVHADQKIVLEDGGIEVIVGFAMRSGDSVVRLPTRVSGSFEGIPLGSPEVWAVAYALLGREPKSLLLFRWLEEHGADPGAVNRMLDEPLPPDLERRMRALAKRNA